MKLVIVESPTKAKTISRFLGSGFQVESSYGHVRDLPSSVLGVDVEQNFQPKYVIPKKAKKRVGELKEAAKKATEVILATDEDREGEAISWHLVQALGLNRVQRIVFHEITKRAVEEALKNPRDIDTNLVDAQQGRRVLDRLVGYKLSPFLWKKIMRGLSAGRVQSVALRFIVEREREREQFKREEYWKITAVLLAEKGEFEAALIKLGDKMLDKFAIPKETDVKRITADLKEKTWRITNIEKRVVARVPSPPFITSTLQQESSKLLYFSAKQTMVIAQQLYEGIETSEDAMGLITYMRTDSVNLSKDSVDAANKFIVKEFGKEYVLRTPRVFKTKAKRAQEAHEAIRPTDVSRTPESLKKYLDIKQLKLYTLIWQRFIASQMSEAVFDATVVDIEASPSGKTSSKTKQQDTALFRANGQVMKFDGFTKVWALKTNEVLLPELSADEKLSLKELRPSQHFTEPPARFSEAMLIKTLEEYEIGRPSTYAPTISTIVDRGYVIKNEKKRFEPTEIGKTVNDMLVENFPKIVDVEFTAKMEEELDDIASGKRHWTEVIKEFYTPFSKNLEEKFASVKKQDMTEATDEICEKCGKQMVIKHGRFGRFIACSGFPDCKNTKALPAPSLNIPCLKCNEGEIVQRMTRKRRMFFGCSRWPDCDYASWKKPEPQEIKEEL